MKQIAVSDRTFEALTRLADHNFRTVDLQISFWLSQDVGTAEKRSYAKRKVDGPIKRKWSHAKREAQSERMKKLWETGAIRRKKKADKPQELGHISFDD